MLTLALLAWLFVNATPKPTPMTILRCDEARFHDSVKLEWDLHNDIQDMDVTKFQGLDLKRIREENRLFAKIEAERGDCGVVRNFD